MDSKTELQKSIETVLEEDFNRMAPAPTTQRISGIEELVNAVGPKLAAQLLGLDSMTPLRRWIKNQSKPTAWQLRSLEMALGVVRTVQSIMSDAKLRKWLQEPSENLAGYSPAFVMSKDATLVRDEALRLVSGR